jgi:hypothetical protein
MRFLYNQVWNVAKSEYVVAVILLMQEGIISKEIILNKLYLLCTVFYLISLRTF